jgi:hypothetical protein
MTASSVTQIALRQLREEIADLRRKMSLMWAPEDVKAIIDARNAAERQCFIYEQGFRQLASDSTDFPLTLEQVEALVLIFKRNK